MTISFPSNTSTIIDAIRDAIGRGIIFVSQTEEECTVCSLDPVTLTSTDTLCVTCSGRGYIYTDIPTTISGHVSWGDYDRLGWDTGGKFYTGDCGAQIKYSTDNLATVEAARRVLVDGKTMRIRNKLLRGVPSVNRILLDLVEEEEE